MQRIRAAAFAALYALSSCVGPALAPASEMQRGRGPVCNTAEQIEQYVALVNAPEVTESQTVLDAINRQAGDPAACVIAEVMFERGADGRTLSNRFGTFVVAPVTIHAVIVNGMAHLIEPLVQYSLFPAPGHGI